MEQTFKSFVKKETRKEKIKKVEYFLANNGKYITIGAYILSIVFALLYCIFADSYTEYDSKINSITANFKTYVNDIDTSYNMNITINQTQEIKNIELTKKEYNNYYNSYNNGVRKYLYSKNNWFYFVCFIYLGINLIYWIFGD